MMASVPAHACSCSLVLCLFALHVAHWQQVLQRRVPWAGARWYQSRCSRSRCCALRQVPRRQVLHFEAGASATGVALSGRCLGNRCCTLGQVPWQHVLQFEAGASATGVAFAAGASATGVALRSRCYIVVSHNIKWCWCADCHKDVRPRGDKRGGHRV
jgi:hypothetical protein